MEEALTVREQPELEAAPQRTFDVSLKQKLEEPKPEPMRRQATAFMPPRDTVLVRPCTQEEMSESGLIVIPKTAQEKPMEGVALAVGRGRADMAGREIPMEWQPGDRVLYGKYAGGTIVLRGEELRLLRGDEILGAMR